MYCDMAGLSPTLAVLSSSSLSRSYSSAGSSESFFSNFPWSSALPIETVVAVTKRAASWLSVLGLLLCSCQRCLLFHVRTPGGTEGPLNLPSSLWSSYPTVWIESGHVKAFSHAPLTWSSPYSYEGTKEVLVFILALER